MRLEDFLLIINAWAKTVENFKPPRVDKDITEPIQRIDFESYNCNLYKSLEAYHSAMVDLPVYPWLQDNAVEGFFRGTITFFT